MIVIALCYSDNYQLFFHIIVISFIPSLLYSYLFYIIVSLLTTFFVCAGENIAKIEEVPPTVCFLYFNNFNFNFFIV